MVAAWAHTTMSVAAPTRPASAARTTVWSSTTMTRTVRSPIRDPGSSITTRRERAERP